MSERPRPATFEFHVARKVRAKYAFEETLFSLNGNVILADFRAVRELVHRINAVRPPETQVSAGLVNGVGLLDEIYHHLFRIYETEVSPGVFGRALAGLEAALGTAETRRLLLDFTAIFPPRPVYREGLDPEAYLGGTSGGRAHAEMALEELILLHLANFNPAAARLTELFDDHNLAEPTLYAAALGELTKVLRREPGFGPRGEDLLTFCKAPILSHPGDLAAQLAYIREHYALWLGDLYLRRILSGDDLLKEDRGPWPGGPGGTPTAVPGYRGPLHGADGLALGKSGYRYAADSWKDYEEPDNFTADTDWMPRVVLMAKNCAVWLDQLSHRYGRAVTTLDQIPDEELDRLAAWGFNALWLIGVWERSPASRRIKHLMGNIDAVSSAYSLYDYRIAAELGGEEALRSLDARARARGIRLTSDMVPNHTGIYSRWILEHPEYFIQTPYPPFPNYRFTGADLSEDPAVQLRIEDGYWSRRDAAVAFQRIDNRTGEIRYIYHGNDGTNMPWNDTAQLDMLRRNVREAVIGQILNVAGRFSIIRFDAAMTLTKRHFARLWYPEPGGGGDIPSRADFALSKEEFERAFPEEFWREVVDRVNAERPDTLLLAEAFWLLEGYFVRSLGMHRVYNSAFMHMQMKEENAKYRRLLAETLEFEPEILKRYVSFMSNPDEETAIRQFGTDDKYFGVCVLLSTLPGLPMFGHGQIEGLTEKYGMEYLRAYYQESPNEGLIARHEREIFPLLKKRYLFSPVADFWLFDVRTPADTVDENVFAFVNRARGERALVLYNNKYERAAGRIFRSTPKLTGHGGAKAPETRTLAEALGLNPGHGRFYLYRDAITGREYIRSGADFAGQGFDVELDGFKYRVFLDWREVVDELGDWERLARRLGRQGVPDIARACRELKLEPVHRALSALLETPLPADGAAARMMLEERFAELLDAVREHLGLTADPADAAASFRRDLARAARIGFGAPAADTPPKPRSTSRLDTPADETVFRAWLALNALLRLFPAPDREARDRVLETLLLETPLRRAFERLGRGGFETSRSLTLLTALLSPLRSAVLFRAEGGGAWAALLADESVRAFLGFNEYEGVRYISREGFEELVDWLSRLSRLEEPGNGTETVPAAKEIVRRRTALLETARRCGYRYDVLLAKLAAR
jgi:glycosidase